MSGSECQAAQALALAELQRGRREFSRALRHARLEFSVELFELSLFPVQLDKHFDLRAQNFRNDRHRHVIDCAHLVTAQTINVGQQDGGNENERCLLEAGMIADHRGQLEAVDVRHIDVDENDSDVILQEQLERFRSIARAQQVLTDVR